MSYLHFSDFPIYKLHYIRNWDERVQQTSYSDGRAAADVCRINKYQRKPKRHGRRDYCAVAPEKAGIIAILIPVFGLMLRGMLTGSLVSEVICAS